MNRHNSIICISASGYLESDCEIRTDKNGHQYLRFKMICTSTTPAGATVEIPFRCFTYNMKYSHLRQGALVFVMGEFKYSRHNDKINFDIYVNQITHGGYNGPNNFVK